MRSPLALLIWAAALAAPIPLVADESDLFATLDANQDGFVTKDEAPGEKQRQFERLLRTNDKNGDGKLSREEFVAKAAEPAADPPATRGEGRDGDPAEFFKRLDKDGDGKLNKEEAPERLRQFFDRVDVNSDGKIDAAEFREVAARLGGGAPGRPAGAGGDGELAEIIRRLSADGFDRNDANKDGKITLEEVPEGRQREAFKRVIERVDADGDKAVTKEEFAKAALAARGADAGPMPLIRLLDADGNGEISAEEISNASKVLLKLDRNGDGKLSRDELPGPPTGGAPDPRAVAEQILRRFKNADKNGDGKLQKDEAPPGVAAVFDRADTNGDGALDESELKAAIERLSQRREGGEPRRERPKPRD
jgi:collagen type III alpha